MSKARRPAPGHNGEEGVTFLKGLTATRITPEAKVVTLDDGCNLCCL